MVANAIERQRDSTAAQSFAAVEATTQRKLSFKKDAIASFNGAVMFGAIRARKLFRSTRVNKHPTRFEASTFTFYLSTE